MDVNYNLITTVAECDDLISMAQRERRILQHRMDGLDMRNEFSLEGADRFAAELAQAQAQLDSLNSLIPTLADGPLKEDQITKRMEAEVKLRRMQSRGGSRSPSAIVAKQYEGDMLERQVAFIDEFITNVQARKTAIVG